MRHSGGERRRWTSAMVTLYLEVEDSRDSRPGVEQKISKGNFWLGSLVAEEEVVEVVTCSWGWPNSRLMGKVAMSRGRKESPVIVCNMYVD